MMPLSTEENKPLKRRDREVMTLADFTDADIVAIEKVKPSAAASAFDHEMERWALSTQPFRSKQV